MNNFSRLTPHNVAEAMGISTDVLWHWVNISQVLFKPVRKERGKGGKVRDIEAPHFWAKARLRMLHRFLQLNYPGHLNAHGGVKGRSCFTGAKKHLGRRHLVVRDISGCYPSISRENLRKHLVAMGFRHDTALVLAGISTVGDHIPQGSPISSDLLNLFLYDADENLAQMEKQGVRFHRCYDDIVASTNSRELATVVAERIESLIADHELQVNEKKREKNGHTYRNSRQLVHNLDVSNPAGVAICREDRQRAAALAEYYVREARAVRPETLETIATKRKQVVGYICHFGQAKFSNAKHLRKLVKHGDRFVTQALFAVDLDSRNWFVTQGRVSRAGKLAKSWKRKLQKIAV